jgi:hypothetical protein
MQSQADDSVIGYIKTVNGEAELLNLGAVNPAQVGSPVQIGNVLRTGDNGSIGVTFKDDTVMSIGNNTTLTIEEYLYSPTNNQLKLVANLVKGTLHYISGVIAKLRPDAILVKTPTSTIGVRGTRFVVKAGDE